VLLGKDLHNCWLLYQQSIS